MEEDVLNPLECLRVIARATYYPIGISADDQVMTLRNSLDFVRTNFGEGFSVLRSKSKKLIIKMWNNIMFSICVGDTVSEELGEYILCGIRDIAVFLFGPNFDTVMGSRSISSVFRDIFAKYVETLFHLGNKGSKGFMFVPEVDFCEGAWNEIRGAIGVFKDPNLIELLVFRNHIIIMRFRNKRHSLEGNDEYEISLLERIEFADAEMDDEVKVPEESWIKHKKIFLVQKSIARSCYLSLVRLGEKSPFTLVFVSKASEPDAKAIESTAKISQICAQIISATKEWKTPRCFYKVRGMILYLMINRRTGIVKESQRLDPSSKDYITIEKLRRRMISLAMKAVKAGHLTMVRNEMSFQYTYEMRFLNAQGQIITPSRKIKVGESNNLSQYYNYMLSKWFVDPCEIQCCELLTIWLGVVSTEDVLNANNQLFTKLVF